MNIMQAHAAISRIYNDTWGPTGHLVLYEDVPLTPAQQAVISGSVTPTKSWARLSIKDNLRSQATIGNSPDCRRFEAQGVILIEVYTPSGMGGLAGYAGTMCTLLQSAFETPNIADPWFRNARINPVGLDRFWYHANVVVEFSYAEAR